MQQCIRFWFYLYIPIETGGLAVQLSLQVFRWQRVNVMSNYYVTYYILYKNTSELFGQVFFEI